MYFDTHAHYENKQFNNDRDELLDLMLENDVSLILNAGSNLKSSKFSLKLADRYEFIYASVGVHPHDSKDMTDDMIIELKQLLTHPKAMAVGEIGLDFHYDFSPRDIQKKRFWEQLELARKVKKPVVIHMREATEETLDIISEYKDLTGVFHCFPGSWETAKTILDTGWYISFTGVVTFKNARKAIEVIEKMPMDRLLLETDCPYMSPEPFRGRRNCSINIKYIAAKIAEIREISLEEVADITKENGKRLFQIM